MPWTPGGDFVHVTNIRALSVCQAPLWLLGVQQGTAQTITLPCPCGADTLVDGTDLLETLGLKL